MRNVKRISWIAAAAATIGCLGPRAFGYEYYLGAGNQVYPMATMQVGTGAGYLAYNGVNYMYEQAWGHQGYGVGMFPGYYFNQLSAATGIDSVGYLGLFWGLPPYGLFGAGYDNPNWAANWQAEEMSRPHYWDWYHQVWHGNFARPWYYQPLDTWANHDYDTRSDAAYCTPFLWGYWSYANPYAVSYDEDLDVDYSKPLVFAGQAAGRGECQRACEHRNAMLILDKARHVFLCADYRKALEIIDDAITHAPGDPTLHEFRGLALFALERYQEAAGALHAVLASRPGWDWGTIRALYSRTALYNAQIRTLERFVQDHPGAGDAFFVLGYHYASTGFDGAAAAQFRIAARLNTTDVLSQKLADSLGTVHLPQVGESSIELATSPQSFSPLGDYGAIRSDGVKIRLNLMGDQQFCWTINEGEHAQQFRGTFSMEDNRLMLRQENTPMLVGEIRPLRGGGFRFKLNEDNPGDHGLFFRSLAPPTCGGPADNGPCASCPMRAVSQKVTAQ